MEMEAALYTCNAFVGLSYSEFWLPGRDISPGGNLVRKHLVDFVKRLRWRLDEKIRVFYCGEYGDQTQRAHFHLIIFNYPACRWGQTRHKRVFCCESCQLLQDLWPMGEIHSEGTSAAAFEYVAGYVTKKLTRKDDERLMGRNPEFGGMSKGIGKGMIPRLAKQWLETAKGPQDDVPDHLLDGTRRVAIGRYLTAKFRTEVGRDPALPQIKHEKYSQELLRVRALAKSDAVAVSAKEILIRETANQRNAMVVRMKAKQRRWL